MNSLPNLLFATSLCIAFVSGSPISPHLQSRSVWVQMNISILRTGGIVVVDGTGGIGGRDKYCVLNTSSVLNDIVIGMKSG